MYSLTILLPLLFPAVQAHMALWHPAALDFNGDGYEASVPLSGESFSTWWFHGALDKASSVTEKLSLPAGESVTVELACNKRFTSYGTDAVDNESCPDDVASNHAGSPINQSELRGCALAIAYKSDFADVNPDDFAVFSVNTQCVQNKDTSFEVPAVMPVCPSGGCICAWFWQGQESDDEMYMTGFRCNVEGGAANASIKKPQPPTYCPSGTGCVSGAKQPMYWANDDSNIAFTGDYEKKPSYNSVWGFENGAQNDIVSGGSKANPAAPAVTEAPSNAEDTTTTATLKTTRQRTTMVTKTRTGVAYAQPTAVKGCKWNGHCAGDSCYTMNDCDGELVCNASKCASVQGLENYN